MDEKNIKEYIRALEHITVFLRNLLEEEKAMPLPGDSLKELTELRMLSKSEAWPAAVPNELLCEESDGAKMARASGILQEFVKTEIEGKKFLDFGCGEGHVPFISASLYGCEFSAGYDVIRNPEWDKFHEKNRDLKNFSLTNNWEEVVANSPYDVIIANDVLDHSGDPIKALQQIRSVKKDGTGKVFIRCHPWTSRHGTHLYRQLNKAYLHLVFSKEELYSMGLKEIATQPALDPLGLYRLILKDAGFTVISEEMVTQPVEMFFTHNPLILRRIKEKWKTSSDVDLANGTTFPREILEIQFVDYSLI